MGPVLPDLACRATRPGGRVAGFASTRTRERTIEIGPRAGERFAVVAPRTRLRPSSLESGVTANLVASFETKGHYVSDFELHGTEGVISFPDPNGFDGPVRLRRGREGWQDVRVASRGARDARGIGIDDLVAAIAADRPERASGSLGCTSSTSLAASSPQRRRVGLSRSGLARRGRRRCPGDGCVGRSYACRGKVP